MIDANRRLLSTGAAMLLVVTLTGAGGLPEAVTEPPVDAPAVASDDEPTEVGWRLLASLDYRTGEPGEELAALAGQLVKVPGFTVPLEDWASSATEFLLVPYVGACIHTPPPPPNQLVYIEMEDGQRAKLDGWNPVWVEGVLEIETTESVYGYVGFTITGQRVYPYEP
ncbi:DUF3299 domain-containing protein [Candidatus Palauibacter sp.]|uniref:DUF3299 domain-containing protein n=1 Tax=Candidatus Palauibacter sp. TaxID=3101350 RepID=UPI003B51C7F8